MSATCRLHPTKMPVLTTQLLGLELLQRLRRLSRRLGFNRPQAFTPDQLQPPDTPMAERARALMERLSTPTLANHCHRSYVFGLAIGLHRGDAFDRELLYVATILHDLGLTDAHRGPDPFETRGAAAARSFCIEEGLSNEKAELVAESIELHTTATTAFRQPQIALVQLGAGADVIGYHLEDVARETKTYAVQRHPRLGMKRAVADLLRREAAQNPEYVVGAQMKLGFAKRIHQAPFAE